MGEGEGGAEGTPRQSLQEQSCQESNPTCKRAIELVSSLASLSRSIKVFTVKWQLIRSKLVEISSALVVSDEGDELSGMVQEMMVTVGECRGLAEKCMACSYGGKLLMQSNLDMVLTKLHCHVKNLSGMRKAGPFPHGYAIVVSKPRFGACKEDMRFYVKDLLTRMKIEEDPEIKRQALVSLHEVASEDERFVKVVTEVGEIIHLLVSFLDSLEIEVQEEAARMLSVVAGFESCRDVVISAGIVAPLVRVLEWGGDVGKELSARSLLKLTANSENAWRVAAHGGVTALLRICSSSTDFSKAELICSACGVLQNLAGVLEIKRFMLEEGVISVLLRLAGAKDETVQISSIEFLQDFVSGDEFLRRMVVEEGGLHALMRLLNPLSSSSSSSKALEVAFRAIEDLCFSSETGVKMLLKHGFVEVLVRFLRDREASVQELAFKAAFKLTKTSSDDAKRALGDAGFMPEIVRFLGAKSHRVGEMAADALSSMVSIPRNRKRFAQDEQNMELLMHLLETEADHWGGRKFLLSALMSLTSCGSGRKKIANSGYLRTIEKLAEDEVSDAKRLVRKLSTNKFRSMLSGIWQS
ncbi:importin subunit alpha-1-like [Syzygium oleosum]|uniref:importin subunit alpha-1-like n=1 Tax=Syzygium oleosum TaxID=219896 RepID=UPI0011D1ED3F|nr:importin subunit alpha-1-like [Syzygium oleosum]